MLHIRLGAFDKNEDDESVVRVDAGAAFSHYDYDEYANDIALIKLDRKIELTDRIRPVCLPDESDNFEESTCIVTGWGGGDKNSSSLQMVKLYNIIHGRRG